MAISYDASPGTPTGLQASVRPAWGADTTVGASNLWNQEAMGRRRHRDRGDGRRIEGEVGYTMRVGRGLIGNPRVRFSESGNLRGYGAGYGLQSQRAGDTSIETSIDAYRTRNRDERATNAVQVSTMVSW